jgi:hypothetical protein
MRSVASLAAAAAVFGAVSAAPAVAPRTLPGTVYPLPNGFPNPSAKAELAIQQQAHGTEPNGPPPPSLSAEGVTNLQLIALNEIFEVAYFTELLANITKHEHGYTFDDKNEEAFVIEALTAIQAQEELHALNANGALAHFNVAPIEPCRYSFPVNTFADAIALASTFTDVVLGTLQDVSVIFGENGNADLSGAIASVIGQEGEQNGWYRILQSKIPSALPFLTASARDFAFTAIQSFVIPGSCPNIDTIKLTTFEGLTVVTPPTAHTCDIELSYKGSEQTLYVVYINQQNVPVVETPTVVSNKGGVVTLKAAFPYEQYEMNGLTIAALTTSKGPFASADDVAAATKYGPGLIEIN